MLIPTPALLPMPAMAIATPIVTHATLSQAALPCMCSTMTLSSRISELMDNGLIPMTLIWLLTSFVLLRVQD